MLHLTAQEQSIRNASDGEVERWLAGAHNGDEAAREKLCSWAYLTAADYYHRKVAFERKLTSTDADELTSRFFVEFEQALPRIRVATHFARRLLKGTLGRYIQREGKLRRREPAMRESDIRAVHNDAEEHQWEHWTDREWYQYEVVLQSLRESDEITRTAVTLRSFGEDYNEIAAATGLSEAALRMRVARFHKAVRKRFEDLMR